MFLCIQIAENQPLIGNRDDFSGLEKEFEEDPVYQLKIQVKLYSDILTKMYLKHYEEPRT